MRDYNVNDCVNFKHITKDYNNNSKIDYKKLCELYNTKIANNSHLLKLTDANKQLEDVFQEKCYYPLKRKKKTIIEILHKDDHLAKTRTEQLALPKPRSVYSSKSSNIFKVAQS